MGGPSVLSRELKKRLSKILAIGDPIHVAFQGETQLNHRGIVTDFGKHGIKIAGIRHFHDDLGRQHSMSAENVTWQKSWKPALGSPADVEQKRNSDLKKLGIAQSRLVVSQGGGI
jgi:hypothetical protein